jgi:hypothetical protein
MKINNLVFSISLEDLQSEALRIISRTLNEDEVNIARKGLEYGLLTDIDIIYKTIFSEMIK